MGARRWILIFLRLIEYGRLYEQRVHARRGLPKTLGFFIGQRGRGCRDVGVFELRKRAACETFEVVRRARV